MKLFAYGSLLLPQITQEVFKTTFVPELSVFIKGFKLLVENANSSKHPNYHFIKCYKTDNESDIIPGFIIDVSDDIIPTIDRWEGSSYERKYTICYDRNMNKIGCYIYLHKT